MSEDKKQRLPVLALDLGGTKVSAAVISDSGEMMAREYQLIYADQGQEAVIKRIFSVIKHVLSLKNIDPPGVDSISISAAGAIDTERGLVTLSPNLPGWHDVPLRDMVKQRFGIKTFLVNDASAAALGEYCFGAGKGVNNLVFLIVGTGIGGGIIIDGKLYLGASGSAGEIGHITIDINGPKCSCGNTGCLEVLVSGTAVAREAIKRIKSGEKTSLTEMVAGRIEDITAEDVSLAAQDGDSLASEVIATAANYLGIGMVNVVNIFNPEMIIVGGGMSGMGGMLIEPAKRVVSERAFPLSAKAVSIVPAQLGNDAGLFGAAAYAFQQGTAK